jgi:two-component system, cell cycle response regulator CtrA
LLTISSGFGRFPGILVLLHVYIDILIGGPVQWGWITSTLSFGELVINIDEKTAYVSGNRLHLTTKEFQLLEALAMRRGSTLTKEMILNQLYGGMDEPEPKIIDVFVCKLRKKLTSASGGIDFIETVWGRGYLLREVTAEEQQLAS